MSAPPGDGDGARDRGAADARDGQTPPAAPGRAPLFDVSGVHDPLADLGRAAGEEIDEHLHRTHRRPRTRVRAYAFLLVAIAFGVTGTSALAQSEGFTRVGPLAVLALAYLASFLALTRALRVIPVGIAYAIWSGVGIALITLIGFAAFGQSLAPGQLVGIALIVAGVVLIQLSSRVTGGRSR